MRGELTISNGDKTKLPFFGRKGGYLRMVGAREGMQCPLPELIFHVSERRLPKNTVQGKK